MGFHNDCLQMSQKEKKGSNSHVETGGRGNGRRGSLRGSRRGRGGRRGRWRGDTGATDGLQPPD